LSSTVLHHPTDPRKTPQKVRCTSEGWVRPKPRPAFASVACYPLTFEMPEIVDCAVDNAEFTDAVPLIAAWIAVQMACDTFG
jgi:hypothetical protein